MTIKLVLGNLYSSPPSLLYCYLHFWAGFLAGFFILSALTKQGAIHTLTIWR